MQQGGSQYGVSPETTSFAGNRMLDPLQQQQQLMQQQKPGGDAALAEAASPISSRPPARGNFDELGQVSVVFPDDDTLVGEEAERGGVAGNRWPRQETLDLLKIRLDMDAAFRDATLKGPLWEDVSRKLAELGYNRSSKKCKEKFENVHKYYKRTKEGRAGRQDGKSYRFFTQLEALHSATNSQTSTAVAAANPSPPTIPITPVVVASNPIVVSSSSRIQPSPVSAPAAAAAIQINVPKIGPDLSVDPVAGMSGSAAAGISFSSNSSSSSDDSEEEIEEVPSRGSRKRKRSGSGGGSGKLMAFFEGLMRQVIEKQEAMQERFLEAIEKREQDRMIREEAWKRQEMARLAREHEIMAQERAMSASRDAAVMAFLQKLTGQTIQIPQFVAIPAPQPQVLQPEPPPPPPQPVPQQQQQQQQQLQLQQQQQQQSQNTKNIPHQPSSLEVVVVGQQEQEQQQEMGSSFDQVSSSRWPKSEVLALIKIRSGLETRYQEAGPKGPLWEEISSGMQRLGFNRNAKRCKEKWENINKYFKKVKESNKKRPEDAKTCPYFHQLDALYRKKILGSGAGSSSGSLSNQNKQEQDLNPTPNPQERGDILAIMPPPPQPQPQTAEAEIKTSNKNGGNTEGGSSLQVPTSNGGFPPSFFEEGPVKKPEDIVKELMEQHQQVAMDDYDSDNIDQEEEDDVDDEEDDEDDEEDGKMAYKIQFQRQNPSSSNGGNPASSFLSMVQ